MATDLLRHLGVDEAIVTALQKSYGKDFEELEILQDKSDLRLLLRQSAQNLKPHSILTIHGFFGKKKVDQVAEAEAEYHVERYNCRDTIEFLPGSETVKENLKINGDGLHLGDALLRLLRYLADKVVETNGGWVYVQDMKAEGVIPSDGYQPFSRLRSSIAGYLLKKNPKDFIEANGKKQYRLSADPKNIRFPKEEIR